MRRTHRGATLAAGTQWRIGVVVLAVGTVLLYWAFLHHLPFAGGPHGLQVRAQVRTAATVTTRTPVRVGGTDVGTVEKLEPGPDGRTTTLVMRVTEPGVRLSQDAQAHVRYRTLLGGSMYIDLQPGSASAPPLGHRTIPLARTTAQVDWDEFNGIWAKPVPQGQRRLIKGFASALDDPRALRAFLREASPTLGSIGAAARAGRGEHDGELTDLLRGSARAARALGGDGSSLDNLIHSAERTVAATAGVRSALGATVDAAPEALGATTTTMARLDRTLTRLDPLAEQLLPGARATAPAARRLRPALRGLDTLLRDARPLLSVAPPALVALRRTSQVGLPFTAALRTLSTGMVRELLPWLSSVEPKTRLKIYEEIGPWISGQNDSYANFDDNGFFLRGASNASPASLVLPCAALGDADRCQLLQQVFGKAARRTR